MLTQVWAACKRGVRAVNVFKKKSCGASLCKSETVSVFEFISLSIIGGVIGGIFGLGATQILQVLQR